MRARIVKADEARTDAAHQTRAAQVAEAATEAATSREAAGAWDQLATHAAEQAGECRHGAELAERTRRRWALKCDSMACSIRPGRLPPGGSGLPALRQPATLLSCHRSGRDRPRPFGRTTGPLPRFPAAGVPL